VSSNSSSNKAARAAKRKRIQNRSVQSVMKTRMTKAGKIIGSKGETAQKETIAAISCIDRTVSKGIIHKNKGARLKSRLMKKLNQSLLEKSGG